MRKIILILLISCFYLITTAQVSGRCAHCPPSPTSQNGKVLSSNGTNFQWATPISGEIYDGNGITLRNDSVNLGGNLTQHTIINNDTFRINYNGIYDTAACVFEMSNNIAETDYSGIGMARVNGNTNDIFFLGCVQNNAHANQNSIYGIVASGNNSVNSYMDIQVGQQKWLEVTTDGSGMGIDTTGIEIDTNETWVHGDFDVYGNVEVEDNLIVEDGMVGIGTTNPTHTLEVGLSGGTLGTYFQSFGANGNDFTLYSYPEDAYMFHVDGDNKRILFNESQVSDWSVGIGTSSPQGILDVSSGSSRFHIDNDNKVIASYINGGDDQTFMYGGGSYADHYYAVYVGDQSSTYQYNNRIRFQNEDVYVSNLSGNGNGLVAVDNDGLFSFTDINTQLSSLNTYTTPTLAHNALGAGKPYILSTTIGVVSVLLLSITP